MLKPKNYAIFKKREGYCEFDDIKEQKYLNVWEFSIYIYILNISVVLTWSMLVNSYQFHLSYFTKLRPLKQLSITSKIVIVFNAFTKPHYKISELLF